MTKYNCCHYKYSLFHGHGGKSEIEGHIQRVLYLFQQITSCSLVTNQKPGPCFTSARMRETGLFEMSKICAEPITGVHRYFKRKKN